VYVLPRHFQSRFWDFLGQQPFHLGYAATGNSHECVCILVNELRNKRMDRKQDRSLDYEELFQYSGCYDSNFLYERLI
jgi:hypothetical protein